jgi:hypothetical protein
MWVMSFRPDEGDLDKETKMRKIMDLFKAETEHRPKSQVIENMLFVITYSDQTPEWPF